ncbi:hypothetical protein LTR36_000296 [Oleoguttula mirabilis]|uniref:non-specific serine/threonine protein kinase n=1 Tax=Oleoguttula mirabilis TaxID=1507867 RepID=A0AAV9K070_9PEZI|nr:hypothetical protein LTR36_000296 [Oleoguttula mirabilis]
MAEEGEEKYEVLQKIGQGSFGIIRKVRRRTDNQILCRKEISYSRMSDKERNQLAAELDILKTLRHPNVVQYYSREHLKASHDLHLYMEYCGNGDLGGYIKKLSEQGRWADEEFVWAIFAQLVGALYRCHYGEDAPQPGLEGVVRKGKAFQTKAGHRVILHRDLKPENVFLGQNNAVKLGDFGLSKIIASHDFASTYVGTPFYMSPEICAAERYSHHSDVWSLGCIIYELATRCVPFDARSHVELVMKIKAGKIKPLPEMYSRELWDTITSCLRVNPTSRPDMAQLVNVPQIKAARVKLEQGLAYERAQQERDAAVSRLETATQQIKDLQAECERLREAGKKVEMEWHAKATLAIDQRVAEAEKKQQVEMQQHKAQYEALLRRQFDAAVEQQVDEKLKLHQASLPQSHGLLGVEGETAAHVRSSTPPPGKSQTNSSFATTATTGVGSDGSSVVRERGDDTLETDISSLSIMEQEEAEDVSPLAQRTKPASKAGGRARQLFGRAKTLANCTFDNRAGVESPMDVHMSDPSPMANRMAAPMSIKGLSLSPRRHGAQQDRLSGAGVRKNIFSLAAEQKLRPTVAGDAESSFADDDLLDDGYDDVEPESPSRPSSGASNPTFHAGGDPFKALATAVPSIPQPPPKRMARPSLARQQTMPVNLPVHTRQRSNINIFNPRPLSRISPEKEKEKENRPPSSTGANNNNNNNNNPRSNVPIPAATATSPKRAPSTARDGRVLTPSRKAPAPPPGGPASGLHGLLPKSATAGNLLAKMAHANNFQSPGKSGSGVRGRTLVELAQARGAPLAGYGGGEESGGLGAEGKLLLPPSPAKWDPMDCEEMPSPFLARKGRAMR